MELSTDATLRYFSYLIGRITLQNSYEWMRCGIKHPWCRVVEPLLSTITLNIHDVLTGEGNQVGVVYYGFLFQPNEIITSENYQQQLMQVVRQMGLIYQRSWQVFNSERTWPPTAKLVWEMFAVPYPIWFLIWIASNMVSYMDSLKRLVGPVLPA